VRLGSAPTQQTRSRIPVGGYCMCGWGGGGTANCMRGTVNCGGWLCAHACIHEHMHTAVHACVLPPCRHAGLAERMRSDTGLGGGAAAVRRVQGAGGGARGARGR
jgi:hypothetical protein